MNPSQLQRRQLLQASIAMTCPKRALVIGSSLLKVGAAAAAATTALPAPCATNARPDMVTILYRREDASAPARLDPVVQAATLALEDEFQRAGLRVLQPSAEAYKVMDAGPGVVVTFAEDAGFSMVFSAYKNLRPVPGQEAGIAEVRIQARIFVGRNILVSDNGRGQMFTQLEGEQREFGERRALDVAAKYAAKDLVGRASQRLRNLSPAQLQNMLGASELIAGNTVIATPETSLPPPPPPAPPPPPPLAPAVAPPAAPIAAPAQVVATAPVPAPSPAPSSPAAASEVRLSLPPPAKRWALIIGISDYSSVRQREGMEISDLAGVAKDTENFYRALTEMGQPRSNISLLTNAAATSVAVRRELKKLVRLMAPDDMVIIALSAHGGPKEASISGYGAPILADFSRSSDNAGALDFWELQSLCKALPCEQVLWVIDTCFSGNAARDLVTVEIAANGVKVAQGVGGPDAGRVAKGFGNGDKAFAVVTAASSEEISWDQPGQGGLFTLQLLASLKAAHSGSSIEQLVVKEVRPKVIEASRAICRRRSDCKMPQQTPVFAYAGLGNQIKL